MFGAPASVVRVPKASADHTRIVPHRQNARSVGTTRIGNHACTTSFDRNHTQHTITPPITCARHNGRSYHFCTTGTQHNRPPYHSGITGTCTTELARRAFKKCGESLYQKRVADHAPRTPNGLPLSCAAPLEWESGGVILTVKNGTISGPRSGVSSSGVFGGPRRRSGCRPHGPTIPTWDHTGTLGVRSGSRPAPNHARHNGPQSDPRPSGITPPITCFQHNGPSSHTLHNGRTAQRASVPRLHHGLLHNGAGRTGV